MAQSYLNVSNLALALIGAKKITALADTSKEAIACTDHLDAAKKALLRMHPWNFGIKRRVLTPFQNIAVSNVTFVSANLIEVTHTATTYADGNYVTLSGIEGAIEANGTWEIQDAVSTTVTRLTTIDIPLAADLSTYSASDTDYIRRSPAFDFAYLYAMPDDCLRVLELMEDVSPDLYRVESGMILTDFSSIRIRYVRDVTVYTEMDPMFYQCLAGYLAYIICDHITGSDAKKNELHVYLYGGQGKRGILPQARFVDATEDSIQQMQANDWIASRGTN
jgi:hypothetical protein